MLMGLDLPAADHTTLSRRARTWSPRARRGDRQPVPDRPLHVLVDSIGLEVYGAGQWLEENMASSPIGDGGSCTWRWMPAGEIVAHVMTDQDAGDGSQVEALLDQIDDRIGQFTADAAYDGNPAYDAVTKHGAGAAVVIPPRANAAERPDTDLWSRPQSVAISRSSGID